MSSSVNILVNFSNIPYIYKTCFPLPAGTSIIFSFLNSSPCCDNKFCIKNSVLGMCRDPRSLYHSFNFSMRYYRIFSTPNKDKNTMCFYTYFFCGIYNRLEILFASARCGGLIRKTLVTPVKAAFTDEGFSKSKYTPSVSLLRVVTLKVAFLLLGILQPLLHSL